MAESEGSFSKPRLEAFSDGVIAVIITIMAPLPGLIAEAAQRRKARRSE